jgi:hypothetical protein
MRHYREALKAKGWPVFYRELSKTGGVWLCPDVASASSAENFTAALTGSVAGTVSNAGTGNLLEGAHVERPTLGIVAVADRTGRFMLTGLPAGTHEIVASYTGLDPKRVTINVTLGEQAIRDFELTASIEAQLWAAEPIFGNPVAFTMGEKGRVFVTETCRYRVGGALDLRDDHAPDNLQHEDGPSGLAYYLGTGLNASCCRRIFITQTPDPLCDFCGLGSVPFVKCMGSSGA